MRASLQAWRVQVPQLRASWPTLHTTFDRSVADLASLRMHESAAGGQLFAAGMPWFMAVFGRDTLITCLQTLIFGPELARNALTALAGLQATEDDPFTDAEPGKIVHEVRAGKAATTWFPRYYGTVDATPLFLVLLSEVWRWTDDAAFVRTLREPALRALNWIDEYGDLDGDGFVEYHRRSERGLENQSWKDSHNSQLFHDGRQATGPIAACEVQGYVYDAKLRMAELAREVWRDRDLADRLEREAAELRDRFDEAFWVEERGGFYALALDGEKNRVDSLTSNIGHLLWSGIVPDNRVDAVVDALMGEELWSGLGRADDVVGRRRLQPAHVPQRNRLAARQFAHRARPRPGRPLARGAPDRAALDRGGRALRPSASRGVRGLPAHRDAVPDRLSHRGAASGLGGGDAGAPPPGAARPPAGSRAPGARDGRAAGVAFVGGRAQTLRRARLRPSLECRPRRRARPGRGDRGAGARVRIAVLSPVWFPVPPTGYGGIEWVVSLLADGLADAGHDVTLFASGDSRTRAKLVSAFPEPPLNPIGTSWIELHHALPCYENADEFDVIHDHSSQLVSMMGGLIPTPVVHTVHGPLDDIQLGNYRGLAKLAPQVGLVSISMNQRKPGPDLPWVANIPNALDLDAFPYHSERGEYLLYLGRLSPDKGAHRAIEIAREAGLPIKLAGKKREHLEQEYFDELVAPLLGDDAEYVGETSHATKVDLLQNARATLFPIDWEEPFGLVMIESMACGTPVIATRRGAVPEVVDHGRSGIIVDDYREMVAAIAEADRIEPEECRRAAEDHFSTGRMVADYVAVYEELLAK